MEENPVEFDGIKMPAMQQNNPSKIGNMRDYAYVTIAESEFKKYRVVQDWLFESDFNWVVKELVEKGTGNQE